MPYRVVYRDADGVLRETFVSSDDLDQTDDDIRDTGGEWCFSEYLWPEEMPGYEPPPPMQDRL
jgi:hypothetical protein